MRHYLAFFSSGPVSPSSWLVQQVILCSASQKRVCQAAAADAMSLDSGALQSRERMRVAVFPNAAEVSTAVAGVIKALVQEKAQQGELSPYPFG